MGFIRSLILNRNSILVLAVILGLTLGEYASYLKDYNVVILAVTMTFSMTGLDISLLNKISKIVKPMLVGVILNYLVFGAVLLLFAWLLMPTSELFYGFVVIVAAPPGVAIIPFSYMLKGKVDYAIISVTGGFLASVILAPFIVEIFAKSSGIQPFDLFITMVQMVVLPMVIAQLLRWKVVFPIVQKVRGKVVDWGFALLIFVAVGVNRSVFFTNPSTLFLVFIAIFFTIFGLGIGYQIIAKKIRVNHSLVTTQSMLITIKSSGFSVFTALALFGQEAAIPSAILAIIVLVYLIYLSLKNNLNK
ncbi:MAG TPA: hypothetical protein PL017_06865 [Tenuifilaceae bacterium]|nr:hypothetical protein [Tenuifilaceae bacterium]HPE17376.1 hypothetical protein [Tenuifilaceae bacterium]HPJ45802.1 hypothetical protein [Tenuifilaceae bacterium]HPQ33517.1 hypothetical protein [Tenuifilaceae bacterium]HRX66850.1 hypothetical protein [Tenuifilaceae bacterium]